MANSRMANYSCVIKSKQKVCKTTYNYTNNQITVQYEAEIVFHQNMIDDDDDSLLRIFALKMNYNMFTLAIRKNIKIYTF